MVNEFFLPRSVVRGVLLARGSRRVLRSEQRSRRAREAGTLRPARYGPPAGLASGTDISVQASRHGWPVYAVQARRRSAAAVDIVYLHGGAYIQEITSTHWKFIGQLASRTGARVIVPIYPLAPMATAALTVPRMVELIAELREPDSRRGLVVMGDSAGGGMTLAAAQGLRDGGLPLPDQLVLISPWLDVTVGDPRSIAIQDRDPMLGVAGLRDAGRAYAGALAWTDPLCSPLFGTLSGLPPMLCFAGDADVLHPDSLTLAEKLRSADHERVELEVAASEFHVYPLLPTRAGAQARQRIARAVDSVSATYPHRM